MSNIDKIRQKIENSIKAFEFNGGIYDSYEAGELSAYKEILDFIDSMPEETKKHGCGVEFPHFGANYPDAKCIDGYLFDMDSYEDGVYTIGGDDPCPICNTEEWLKDVLDDEIFKTRDEALEYVKMLKSKYKHNGSLPEDHFRDSTKMVSKEQEEEVQPYCTGVKGDPGPPVINDLEEAAEDSWMLYEYRETPQGLYSSCYRDGFIAGSKWMKSQMPMPEDTVIFMKGVAEGRRLEREDRNDDNLPRYYGD